MKKRVATLTIILLLILGNSFFALAQEEYSSTAKDLNEIPDTANPEENSKPANLKEDLENIKKTKNPFTEEIPLPENIQKPIKKLLGLNPEETLSFSRFIVLIALFILMILILENILSIIPFFETPLRKWAGTVIITLLISMAGGIEKGLISWQALADVFKIPEKIGVFWTGFGIVLGIIMLFILNYFKESLKESGKLAKAHYEGIRIGTGYALAKIFSKQIKKD